MKDINFYCIEEDANSFLYSFLSKLIEKNKRVIVYSESLEKMEKLDNMLWSHKKTEFIPHLLGHEKNAERTPIIISNTKDNRNNANFLLISGYLDDPEFLNKFEKTFYIFSPINQRLIDEAGKNWESYRNLGFNLKLLRKNSSGKWLESNNFDMG